MPEQIVDLPPLMLRADLASFNEEKRTVDLVFSTGAGVERYDWMSGKRYIEKLEISADAVDLTRLNSGAPLLDSHSVWSIADQLGAVVTGSARIEGSKALATVRFSARETVKPVLQDVKDAIVRSVSVGYRVTRYEESAPVGNELPVRTATRWMPYEVSLVSMPADIGAKVRDGDKSDTNRCLIVSSVVQTRDADRLRRFRLAQALAFSLR